MDEELLGRVAAAIREYGASLADRPAYPASEAISGLSRFDEALPNNGAAAPEIIGELDEIGRPATVAGNGGRYFGFVTGGTLPAALGANMIASAWDQCASGPVSSPVASRLEAIASKWVLELLGLPSDSGLGFMTGSSIANLACLTVARDEIARRQGVDIARDGLELATIDVVASTESHATVIRALRVLGLGARQIRMAACDGQGRVDPDQLPELSDRTILCLQAGNVNSGASDPFPELVAAARTAGAWVHVDGAFGLWAAASPELSREVRGASAADSWAVDAHKWLNTPYDCAMAIVRDAAVFRHAMSAQASYMLNDNDALDPSDFTLEFSRRARGIDVWAAIRQLGATGIAHMIERNCALARRFAAGVEQLGFEVLNRVVLNQVVVSLPGALNADAPCSGELEAIIAAVQKDGTVWFGATRWRGRPAFRFSVSSHCTDERDIDRALECLETAKARVHRREPLDHSRLQGGS